MTVNIKLNGESKTIDQGMTPLSLLEHLNIAPKSVVIEHNGKILEQHQLADIRIEPDDTIEIIRFVGGG